MRQIILILTTSLFLISGFYACKSKNEKRTQVSSIATSKKSVEEPNYPGGLSSAGRLFPDKLRHLPVGIEVSHYPNPCYAVMEDSMYIWKHNTTVKADQDLQIVEYGSFVYTAKGWYLRITMDAQEFATTYNCKNGLLRKGIMYTDKESWRRDKKLSSGDALWYYVAKDKNGLLVKGTGPIETEGRLLNNTTHAATVVTSTISWTGYGEIGNYSLSGTVPVKKIAITVDTTKMVAVNLTINLAALKSNNDQLVEHLRGEDFFDVVKYPTATFSSDQIIYNDANHAIVSGTITIKDLSRKIKFPLLIENKNGGQLLSGKITMDRTVFGIRYNSKSFFSDLGDQAIKNNFDLHFSFRIK